MVQGWLRLFHGVASSAAGSLTYLHGDRRLKTRLAYVLFVLT